MRYNSFPTVQLQTDLYTCFLCFSLIFLLYLHYTRFFLFRAFLSRQPRKKSAGRGMNRMPRRYRQQAFRQSVHSGQKKIRPRAEPRPDHVSSGLKVRSLSQISGIQPLTADQVREEAVLLDQFFVGPVLNDPALVQDQDPVTVTDGRKAVGYDDPCAF